MYDVQKNLISLHFMGIYILYSLHNIYAFLHILYTMSFQTTM